MTTAILKIKEKPHISVREMGFSKSAKGYRLLLNSDLRLI
jgi:hypothetical protein